MTESGPTNGLCTSCNVNQTLKIRQLANFMPCNEESFNEEVEEFRIKLDRWYELCDRCADHRTRSNSLPPEFYTKFENLRISSPKPEPRLTKTTNQKIFNPTVPTPGTSQTTAYPPMNSCFTPSRPVLNENIRNSPDQHEGYNAWHLQFLPVTHWGYPNFYHPPLNGCYRYEFQPPGAWRNYSTFVPPSIHNADLQYAEQKSLLWVWTKRVFFLTATVLNLVAGVFYLESIIHEWF